MVSESRPVSSSKAQSTGSSPLTFVRENDIRPVSSTVELVVPRLLTQRAVARLDARVLMRQLPESRTLPRSTASPDSPQAPQAADPSLHLPSMSRPSPHVRVQDQDHNGSEWKRAFANAHFRQPPSAFAVIVMGNVSERLSSGCLGRERDVHLPDSWTDAVCGRSPALIIYQHDNSNVFWFGLDGRLEGGWVSRLESNWRMVLPLVKKKPLRVDLSDLQSADDDGIELLGRMRAAGVQLLARRPPASPSLVRLLGAHMYPEAMQGRHPLFRRAVAFLRGLFRTSRHGRRPTVSAG